MNGLDAIYAGLAVVTAPWWMRKSRGNWGERFGKIAPVASRGDSPRVLLHAVSVGEVNALRTLVPLLAVDAHVIVSVGTDTGIARARELFAPPPASPAPPRCDVVRYPVDFSRSVRRFLDATRPDVVALVELELWPNFVRECGRRRVPVCVINGRLSERSFRGYRRLRAWMGRTFGALAFAAVQDEAYAERFRAMGVARDRCFVTGSMKWDAAKIEDTVPGAEALARDLGIDGSRPLIVAGSTGPGEESLLHGACPAGAQLLCAPRKPERFDEAAAALPGCVRRSRGERRAADRYLLDTIGELRAAYALADVVVVGRSFGDLFGSDPIEPITLGKATVIGPAVSDFSSVVGEFERAGGIERATRETLAAVLRELLADAARRTVLAERGRACIRSHQGASAAHARMVMGLVSRRPAPGAASG